jgi:L-threonylcarbamoyladenylate synthase
VDVGSLAMAAYGFTIALEFHPAIGLTMTILMPATPAAIHRAAEVLRRGGLVAFPTETVYGLGALATNDAAVRAMFAAKGRPADHPVIVHLADVSHLCNWARDVPEPAQRLAAAFWPGPLTMILRRNSSASSLVTGGLDTIGLRVPAHPIARQLLNELSGAIAAPSANRFGRVSPTTAQHVLAELKGKIDLILDGGPCEVGLESTIVDLSGEQPAVLRPGGVTLEQISNVLGPLASAQGEVPRVSGSLESHYAPRATVELVLPSELGSRIEQLLAAGLKVAVLCPDRDQKKLPPGVVAVGIPEDEQLLAQRLYAALREVDERGCDVGLATLPAECGIGAAIADRLRKAAGPRLRE